MTWWPYIAAAFLFGYSFALWITERDTDTRGWVR